MLLFVVLAVGAGAGYWYWKQPHGKAAEYQAVAVARGDLTQAVTATGQLGPVVNVQVGSQISGIVKKLYADFNSVVKSNQVIAEIDPSTYQLNVQRAEAGLANSKANLALTQVQARRADLLFADKLISASDHDTALAQSQQAEAQVQSDEANLKSAKVQLSYCTIYAPVDGVVISRNVDVGQTVAASFNTPTLFIIANDLAKMEIDALVSEADIGGVAVGENVNFTVDAYPYRTFRGKISQVRYGAITNQNVINYDTVIEVNNADLKLLPGMTANVSIITAERENVLKIPNAALRFRPPEAASESPTNAASPRLGPGPLAGGGPGGRGGPGAGAGGGRGGPGGTAGGGRGAGLGGGGPGASSRGPGLGSGHAGPERQTARTVYLLLQPAEGATDAAVDPKPVQIKVGISDGVTTEVLDGLKEGDQVITSMITSDSGAARPANPFGGPFRRF